MAPRAPCRGGPAQARYRGAAVRPGRSRRSAPSRHPPWSIRGQGDRYLGPKLAEPHHEDVPNLTRVERLPNAFHWVHHNEAERVTEILVDFLAPARGSHNGR